MTTETFTELALSFLGTEAVPHFDRTAFKVVKRRTFATLHGPSYSANIVLTPDQQAEFCLMLENDVYPVPNKFGLWGWTTFELKDLPSEVVQAALELAYQAVLEQKKKK